jgi:hypothetical protein
MTLREKMMKNAGLILEITDQTPDPESPDEVQKDLTDMMNMGVKAFGGPPDFVSYDYDTKQASTNISHEKPLSNTHKPENNESLKKKLQKNAGIKESDEGTPDFVNSKSVGPYSNLRQNTTNDIQDVDQQLSKFDADVVQSGIKYENAQMIKKDDYTAKTRVLKNLKADASYYTNPALFVNTPEDDGNDNTPELVPPSETLGTADVSSFKSTEEDGDENEEHPNLAAGTSPRNLTANVSEASIEGDPSDPRNKKYMKGRRWTTSYGKSYTDEGFDPWSMGGPNGPDITGGDPYSLWNSQMREK